MKNFASILVALVYSSISLAETPYYRLTKLDLNFAAPVVPNTTSVTNQPAGTIVYDANTDQFQGLDPEGNWLALSSIGSGPVSSTGSDEIIVRANISNSGSASIASQSGTWLNSVSRTAAGAVTLTLENGVFTNTPSCNVTVRNFNGMLRGAVTHSESASVVKVNTFQTNTATAEDVAFSIICMGN